MKSWWKDRINLKERIKWFIDLWANEFFSGYTPEYWSSKFWFEVSPNWRFSEHEQITEYNDLKEIIETVHSYKREIFWNLNSWYYTWETEEEIKRIISDYLKVWIDWFICWNIWILEYLDDLSTERTKRWYIINWKEVKINISTIMSVYNISAIRFLINEYPVNKIILSREITLREIEQIVTSFPDLLFEVFWQWDFCRYNNGLCFAEHKYTERDICTLVMNDLIVKKTYKQNYREIIWDKEKTNTEKFDLFKNDYKNEFEKLIELRDLYLLNQETTIKEKLLNLFSTIKNKYNLEYDSLSSLHSKENKHIFLFITIYSLSNIYVDLRTNEQEYINILRELLEEWQKEYIKRLKKDLTEWQLESIKLDELYNRSNYLNLYTFEFFMGFKNINTLKFPTRWRDYIEVLTHLKKIKTNWIQYINQNKPKNLSIKRAHYNLDYLNL